MLTTQFRMKAPTTSMTGAVPRPVTLLDALLDQLERDRRELPEIVRRAAAGLTGSGHPLMVARRIAEFEAYAVDLASAGTDDVVGANRH